MGLSDKGLKDKQDAHIFESCAHSSPALRASLCQLSPSAQETRGTFGREGLVGKRLSEDAVSAEGLAEEPLGGEWVRARCARGGRGLSKAAAALAARRPTETYSTGALVRAKSPERSLQIPFSVCRHLAHRGHGLFQGPWQRMSCGQRSLWQSMQNRK